MSNAKAVLDAFSQNGWDSKPFDRMLSLVRANPADAFRLLQLAVQRGGKSATFLDAAVSFVPDDLLSDLGELAANAFLQNNENEIAESVIAYLSMQDAACLQPFLHSFLNATPNSRTYYANWPWRGASNSDIERTLEILQSEISSDKIVQLFRCILEARNSHYITEALAFANSGTVPYDESIYLAEIGFDGPARLLFNKAVCHIRFPIDFLSCLQRATWRQPSNHPTWSLIAHPGRHRFGGLAEAACAVCDGPLHNLITIDPMPVEIEIARLSRLQIATCLSCLGWTKAPLFFHHDNAGTPAALNSTHEEPEFPTCPLQETWVELCTTPSRWKWQDWALSNSRENLHRIGGHPAWIQSAEYPACPSCERLMPMLMQLDSELPTEDGGEWLWGSGGICYVFWCDDCRISASLWQCT